MTNLLREACQRTNKSDAKVLTEAECRSMRKRYRTILTQGGKELMQIPSRPKGKRGRTPKSDAQNPHERLVKHKDSVLRFMTAPDVSLTNNAEERKIRTAKVKIKVSGSFRTQHHAEIWCRNSSYLGSMAVLGYNPLVAIQIALAGRTADMNKLNYAEPAPKKAWAVTKTQTHNNHERQLEKLVGFSIHSRTKCILSTKINGCRLQQQAYSKP